MRALLVSACLVIASAVHAQPASPLKTDATPVAGSPIGGPAASRSTSLLTAPLADGAWDDRFGEPGVWYDAYAVATAPNGDVYVGGSITEAGGIAAQGVARWDGHRWHPLGGGVDGYVYAIAVGADGMVYVGGDFVNAGGVRANSLARWDPATETWASLGGVATDYGRGTVRALALQGTTLYVGGDFTKVNGQAIAGVARYDGTAWSPLGRGVGRFDYQGTFEPGGGTVYALAVSGDAVYVGGQFDAVEAGQAFGVARWDAAAGTWSTLAGGVDQGYSYAASGAVRALAVDGDDLYVGGVFAKAGTVPANNVARWDGTGWHALGAGLQHTYTAQVNGLAVYDGALFATGTFDAAGGQLVRNAARWDGAAWSSVSGGLDAAGSALAVGPDGLYVVGSFDHAGDNVRVDQVARWTGTEWRALGLGVTSSSIQGYVYALASLDGVVYAAGSFTHAGGRPALNIAAWDGTDWSALGEGLDQTVRALAVGADGALYVGGDFTTAGGRTANRIARWDPATRTWSPLGTGLSSSVYALATHGGSLYAGGSFSTAGGVDAKYVARWDGAAWSALGAGVNGRVNAIAVDVNGDVYVGGDIERAGGPPEAGGVEAAGVAGWDGTAWHALGAGVLTNGSYGDYPGEISALAIVGGQLYAGGDFDKAGTTTAPGLARWDGAAWTALGTGLGGRDQETFAFAVDGPWLYVGGSFLTAGDLVANNVARWDTGTDTWTTLGEGISIDDYGSVESLTTSGADLFAGGHYFLTAGGEPASAFARWQGTAAPAGDGLIAVDPLTYDFGEGVIGESLALLVTIRNQDAATGRLTGSVGAPTGAGAAAFVVTEGAGDFALAPGEAHTVIVEFQPAAAGAFAATLPITHDGGNVGSPVGVVLSGTAVKGDALVLRNFDPNGAQLLWNAGQSASDGFVFGPNRYGDQAKATVLDVPPPAGARGASASVEEVRVWFAYKGPMVGDHTYTLHLYEGTAETGPTGTPLYSQTYRTAEINADEDPSTPSGPTVHTFDQPVPVGGSFFVSVDFGDYDTTDLAAIAASDRLERRVPEVWEQLADGSWVNVSDAWSSGAAGWHLWIEAAVNVGGATSVGESAPAVTLLQPGQPNPFRDASTLHYEVAEAGQVSLRVFDLLGREVAVLVDGPLAAGRHTARINGAGLPSGVYVCRLEAGGSISTQKLVLAR